ncbi:MAG: hypothetical protein D6722_19400 [Bacteroidetes bacterium]|nr:MAG: hypothetical protein D6722_19400 [Bacteroidota bacterium]
MLWGLSQALGQAEPEVHLQSIRQAPYQGQNAQGITGDSAFLEYALAHILMAPEDVMFVSNRDLLQSLCLEACDEQEVVILDTVAGGGKPVHLRMTRRAFVPEAHTYAYFEGSDSLIESIDGRPAYGAVDRLPTWSIDTLEVQWGRRSLKVPEEAFADLYDPNFCDADLFRRPLAAYPSLSGRYLYLYVYGGSGGSTYFAKLVFDQKRYLTKIVAEYPDLLRFEAFRDDFIGF